MNNDKELKKILNAWETSDYEELVATAKECVQHIFEMSAELDPTLDAEYISHFMIISTVCADNEINDREYEMITDVLNLSKNQINNIPESTLNKMHDLCPQISHSVDNEIRDNIFMLCLAFAAADGVINEKEIEFIRNL